MKDMFLVLCVAVGLATTAWSVEQMATEEDIATLQADLQNLEAELEVADAVPDELRRRVETIRENAIYLKVKMQRHQSDGGSGTGVEREEVEMLRKDIRALRNDLTSGRSDTAGTVTVPVGSTVSARLLDTLSSETAEPGDSFQATTVDPVSHAGRLAIPAGATIQGRVEMVDRPSSRTDRSSRLVLAFERITIDGQSFPLEATVVDASEDLETGIGDEAAKIGIGAGIGAILGAVLGGDEGAVIGGVIGSAGAVLGTEGKDVVLPRSTILELRLDQELSVPAAMGRVTE